MLKTLCDDALLNILSFLPSMDIMPFYEKMIRNSEYIWIKKCIDEHLLIDNSKTKEEYVNNLYNTFFQKFKSEVIYQDLISSIIEKNKNILLVVRKHKIKTFEEFIEFVTRILFLCSHTGYNILLIDSPNLCDSIRKYSTKEKRSLLNFKFLRSNYSHKIDIVNNIINTKRTIIVHVGFSSFGFQSGDIPEAIYQSFLKFFIVGFSQYLKTEETFGFLKTIEILNKKNIYYENIKM